VLRRVQKTFDAFFRRVKAGKKAGYPRFKPRSRFDSLTFPSYGDGCKVRANGKLYCQGIGELKVKWHRPLTGAMKTVTLKRKAGHWYVCFSVACQPSPLPESHETVGLDVGLESFATLSDGTIIPNPRYFKTAQARLRRAQRGPRCRLGGLSPDPAGESGGSCASRDPGVCPRYLATLPVWRTRPQSAWGSLASLHGLWVVGAQRSCVSPVY
jgi:Probable transposase